MILAELDILVVWQELGGGELRGTRGRAFWRKGDGYTVSLDRSKGVWFDFRDGRGGGTLALVELALEVGRPDALKWLEANCDLDPQRPLSPEEKRRYARAAAEAYVLAQRLADFAWGLELLACRKLEALSSTLVRIGLDPTEPLGSLHRCALSIRTATPDELTNTWSCLMKGNPRAANLLERIGRTDREHAEAVTRSIVDMLARTAERIAA